MTDKFAGISLAVDVSQIDRAVKSLNEFKQANDNAAGGMRNFVDAENIAKQKARDAAREIQSQRESYDDLRKSIDPTISRMKQLSDASKALDKSWSKGLVPDDEFFRLGAVIESQSNALKLLQRNLTEEGRAATAEAKQKEASIQAGNKFIDSLKQQAAQVGKTKEEILQMNATKLGVGDQSAGIIKQISEMKQLQQATREEAAAKAASARDQKSFIASLQAQADAIGKTRTELLEARAAQLGVSSQAAPLIAQLKSQANGMKLAGITAGQYGQAMRMLPAQITDVATSLAGGMPIWLVAIQQGGQIKDSFGGLGNTFKVLTSFISGTVVAVGTLVAVLATMGLAAYQAYQQQRELNSALILTGRYSAQTTAQINEMASGISSGSNATIGMIRGIATELVKSGKYTKDQIALITKATAEWSTVTGQSSDEITGYFEKIYKDPVKGLAELNEQFNFLDKGQLTYIKRLQDTKGKTEAVDAATKLFADTMETRLGEIADSATPLDKMWTDIKKWAGDAWDTVGNRTLAALNFITDIVAQIVDQVRLVLGQGDQMIAEFAVSAGETIGKIPGFKNLFGGAIEDQKKFVADTKKQNEELLKIINERSARLAKGETGYLQTNDQTKGTTGKSSATKDAVAEEAKNLAKKNKEQKVTVDQGDRILDQHNADIIALQSQLKVLKEHSSVNDKISQQRKTLWNDEAKFAVLEEAQKTRSLTKDEKSLLANKDKILQLSEQKAQIGDQIVAQEQLNKRQDESLQYVLKMNAAMNTTKATAGLGDREADRFAKEQQMQADWIAKGGSLTDAAYLKMKEASDNYYAAEDAKRSDWLSGASNAFQNFGDMATNVYQNIGQVVTAGLDGLSSTLTTFLTTGKASFKDFATSIISMIVKMIIQMAIFNAISGALGGASVSSSNNAFSSGSYGGLGFANGGYTGDGGKYEPAGVVHKGEFVFTKEATQRIGTNSLNKMMRGYANGGQVGGSSFGGGAGSSQGSQFSFGDINVDVNNGSDPKGMETGIRAIFEEMIQRACSQGGAVFNYVNSKSGG
jgi:lambda family phage tail tape measure protein